MALELPIDLQRLTFADLDALEIAERQSLSAVLAWIESHSTLSREELLDRPATQFIRLGQKLLEATEPHIEEQRNVKRWFDGRTDRISRWVLFLEAAEGNPLEAQRMENELTIANWLRYRVWRRKGPEGEYLSGPKKVKRDK